MFYLNFRPIVVGISKFNTYRPPDQFLPQDGAPFVSVCCMPTADRSTLTGSFRVAAKAKKPLSIDFNIVDLFGSDLMPGMSCNLTRRIEEFVFHNNCWYSEWLSFNEEVEAGKIKFVYRSAGKDNMSDDDIQAKARTVFNENSRPGSFRLEVTVGPKNDKMLVKVRFLPERQSVCKTHSYLKGGDVKTLHVATFYCHSNNVKHLSPEKFDKVQ